MGIDIIGENALDQLRDSVASGDSAAGFELSGIRKVAQGGSNHFQTEFACEQGEAICWFKLEATALDGCRCVIITMLDISAQRGVEDELRLYRERQERSTHLRIANLERCNTVLRQSYVEQLENECALRQAASVFVNSSQAVVIADDRRRIIKVNEAFSHISGFEIDEVFGRNVGALYADDGCRRSLEDLRQSLEQTGHWQGNSVKLNGIVSEALVISGMAIKPTASFGIGIYPDDGETPESLYQAADAWMYRAKRSRQHSDLCGLSSLT